MESTTKHKSLPLDFWQHIEREKHMSMKLSLFNYTQPELGKGLVQTDRKSDTGEQIGISLTLAKRKDVARAFNLQTKGQACTDKLLELADNMKSATAAEFAKLASSADWTGAGFAVRKGKNGVLRATARLVSVNREAKSISPDQLAAALAKMTDDQRTAILGKAEELSKPLINLPEESASAPAPQPNA
jgi:hypothetical protein